MDELHRSSLSNISLHNLKKVVNDHNSWLANEDETILKPMVEYHAKPIQEDFGPLDSSYVMCLVRKALIDKLINDKASPSIPESATAKENGEPEGSAPGFPAASNLFGEDDDQFEAGSEHGSQNSVPSSLCSESTEVLMGDATKTSDEVDDEQYRKDVKEEIVENEVVNSSFLELGESLDNSKSRNAVQVNEEGFRERENGSDSLSGVESESSGKDVSLENSNNRKKPCNLEEHTQKIREKHQAHRTFLDDNKNEIKEQRRKYRSEEKPLNVALTYYNTNKKITFRLFDDEQEARSWAYDNINLMGKHCLFIQTWNVGRLKSFPLKTKHLARLKVELMHPRDSSTVIKENAFYDTGGETAGHLKLFIFEVAKDEFSICMQVQE